MTTKKATSDYERWLDASASLDGSQNPLRLPYDIALKEAVQVAAFVEKRWEPRGDVPGLSRVRSRLPRNTGADLVSQIHAVQEAQTRFLLTVDPAVVDHGERARFLVDELESAIAFTLDDDIHEEADDQLASLQAFHSQDGQRSSALVQALRDYGALGKQLKNRIADADEEFDPKLIGEALALADTMQPAAAAAPAEAASSDAAREAGATRNRLLSLMTRTVGKVRKVAGHVYRAHPEVLREVTSAYDRKRRAAARRAAKAAEAAATPEPK